MPATVPFVGVLKINFQGQGFEERYVFKPIPDTHDLALPIMQQIAWGRTAFFGLDTELIYARVSQLGPKADKRTCVLPYPLGPHPSFANGVGVGDTLVQINDPRTCVHMAEESAVGQWGNRYVRCLPDSWVVGNKLVTSVQPYFQEPVGLAPLGDMSPAGNLSHLQVCQSFWSFLRRNTGIPHKNGPTDYDIATIAVMVFEQITSRKLGKKFRLPAGKVSAR